MVGQNCALKAGWSHCAGQKNRRVLILPHARKIGVTGNAQASTIPGAPVNWEALWDVASAHQHPGPCAWLRLPPLLRGCYKRRPQARCGLRGAIDIGIRPPAWPWPLHVHTLLPADAGRLVCRNSNCIYSIFGFRSKTYLKSELKDRDIPGQQLS